MSQDLTNHITIDFVNPKDHKSEELMGCYFVYDWSNGTYSFFEEGRDEPLKTGLQKGHDFHVRLSSHPNREWKLHISHDSTIVMVEGNWKENKRTNQAIAPGDYEPEGSYQATAGGSGGVEDDINAAIAGAWTSSAN